MNVFSISTPYSKSGVDCLVDYYTDNCHPRNTNIPKSFTFDHRTSVMAKEIDDNLSNNSSRIMNRHDHLCNEDFACKDPIEMSLYNNTSSANCDHNNNRSRPWHHPIGSINCKSIDQEARSSILGTMNVDPACLQQHVLVPPTMGGGGGGACNYNTCKKGVCDEHMQEGGTPKERFGFLIPIWSQKTILVPPHPHGCHNITSLVRLISHLLHIITIIEFCICGPVNICHSKQCSITWV